MICDRKASRKESFTVEVLTVLECIHSEEGNSFSNEWT
jgi:hypothetical protein